MRVLPATALIAMIATTLMHGAAAEEPKLDAFSGLKVTGDWELVRNNCIACHSVKLVTQQRGTAAQWLSMIGCAAVPRCCVTSFTEWQAMQ